MKTLNNFKNADNNLFNPQSLSFTEAIIWFTLAAAALCIVSTPV